MSVIALAGALALAAPVRAQIARVRMASADAPKMLVVPFQRDQPDSVLSVTLADGLRDRIQNVYLTRFNPILKEGMNRALTESGFPVDVPLEASVVRNLARFLNARLLVEGNILRRPGDSLLVVARLVETGGANPQSATATVTVARGRANSGTGGDLANRLVDAYRSFEDVQQCRQRLEAHQLLEADRAAETALRRFPNSSSAMLCKVAVLRAQNAGADTVEAVLTHAAQVDSLNTTVLRQLATIYQERADTSRLISVLRRILSVDVTDNELRIRTAQLYVQIGLQGGDTSRARIYADSAVDIVDSGLVRNPANIELLTTRSIALGAGRRWAAAAEALSLVASADSQHVDSLFLVRITNYYMAVPDSANLYLWTKIATVRQPQNPVYWYNRSNMSLVRGDTTDALSAARQYSTLQPTDKRADIILARVFFALHQLDSMRVHARAVGTDSALRQFVAPFMVQSGGQYLRDSLWAEAAADLQLARDWAVPRSPVFTTSSFFLGLSQLQLGVRADNEANATTGNCDAVRRERDLLTQSEANIIAGAAQNREQANFLLTQAIPGYRQRSDAFWRNYHCQ